MKKFLFLFFSIHISALFSQIRPVTYTDGLKSHYEVNKIITLSSSAVDGDFQKAKNLLTTTKLDKKSFEYNFSKSYFFYSIYGRSVLSNYLDSLSKAGFNDEFTSLIKCWIYRITKDYGDYNKESSIFRKKYPQNSSLIKLEFYKRVKESIVTGYPNKIEDYYFRITDSVLAVPNISISDKIFFSLFKCDLFSITKQRDKIYEILNELLINYPSLLDEININYCTKYYKDDTFINLNQKLKESHKDKLYDTTESISYKTTIWLMDLHVLSQKEHFYVHNDTTIERILFKSFLTKSKDTIEIERIKGILKCTNEKFDEYAFGTNIPELKFSSFLYSPEFSEKIKSTLPKKQLIDVFKKVLQKYKEDEYYEPFKLEDIYKKTGQDFEYASKEDISYLIGCITLVQYYNRYHEHTASYHPSLSNFFINKEVANSWEAYYKYIAVNPVLQTPFRTPDVNSNEELHFAINVYNKVLKQYPAITTLIRAKIEVINSYKEYHNASIKEDFLSTLIDFFYTHPEQGLSYDSHQYFDEYFPGFTTDESLKGYTPLNAMTEILDSLTIEKKSALIKKLDEHILEKPSQRNLYKLRLLIYQAENTPEKFFKIFLDILFSTEVPINLLKDKDLYNLKVDFVLNQLRSQSENINIDLSFPKSCVLLPILKYVNTEEWNKLILELHKKYPDLKEYDKY